MCGSPFLVAYFHSTLNDIKNAITLFYPIKREKSIDTIEGLDHYYSFDRSKKIWAKVQVQDQEY